MMELSQSELFMINNALMFKEFDIKKTIEIFSKGNIDEHFLDDENEPTYREKIDKLNHELKQLRALQLKIQQAIYRLKITD